MHSDLSGLLEQIHHAVRQGQFQALPDMTAALEARMDEIRQVDVTPEIQRLAQRNAMCLKAAAQGVKAAQRRIAEVQAVRGSLSTYDSSGTRSDVQMRPGRMTERF